MLGFCQVCLFVPTQIAEGFLHAQSDIFSTTKLSRTCFYTNYTMILYLWNFLLLGFMSSNLKVFVCLVCVIRLWECVLDGGLLGTSLEWLNKNVAFVMQLYIAASVKGGLKCFMPMLCLAKINLELICRPKSITKWGKEHFNQFKRCDCEEPFICVSSKNSKY